MTASASAAPSTAADDHPNSRAARLRRQAQDRSRRWRARKAFDAARMAETAAAAEALIERALVDGAIFTALVRQHMALRAETGDPEVAIPFRDVVRVAKEILVEGGKTADWASREVRDRLRQEATVATSRGFPGRDAAATPVSLLAHAE